MKNRLNWAGLLGLGAALMYVFDPFIGRRRRAIFRDKMIARSVATWNLDGCWA
jgi:hypothetical protein